FGQGGFTPTDLGQGAQTTAAVLKPEVAPPGFEFVLLSFAPGPRRAANIAGFQQSMTGFCQTVQQSTCVVTAQRPNGVTNYASIDRTPAVLAALLAVLGIAVLGQFIVVSARQRRRDFAILKTLGLFRRQVRAINAWQDSIVTGLAQASGPPRGDAPVSAGPALAPRPAARHRGRPVELGAVRPRPGHPGGGHHTDLAGTAHGARSDPHRQRGGVLAWPGHCAAEPTGRAARGVTPSR